MATPFHSTERCFRRYEQVIADATNAYPADTKFYCIKRSSNTDAARFNDACNSYAKNNWTSYIDRKKFLDEVYRRVRAIPQGDHVLITTKKTRQLDIVTTDNSDNYNGTVDYPTKVQIDTAISAINLNVVEGPILLSNLTPDQILYVEGEVSQCFNVAIRLQNSNIILV